VSPRFRIERLTRKTDAGLVEELEFSDGLNVIVGPPNAGKTQWVRMLDFLLADPEPFFNRFPSENFDHYDAISAVARIDNETFHIERHLHLEGLKTKVVLDGVPYDLRHFQHWLLKKLHIPLVHYPRSASSLGDTVWPELSFRTLYRHCYRQQRFWSDIADRQTAIESSACILQFLGLAAEIYNDDLEKLRRLREEAKHHSIEIFACRMALSVLIDGSPTEIPSAGELETLDPERVVSKLEEELAALDDAATLNAQDLLNESSIEGGRVKLLIGAARNAGRSAEKLRFAEIARRWAERAERNLNHKQRQIWAIEGQIKSNDLSTFLKDRTDYLCSSMNEYLYKINSLQSGMWIHGDIRIRVSRRNDLRLCVGDIQWDRALGGSDSLLFLMAYHYGLLSLSAKEGLLYPGFVVVDFPAYFRGQKVSSVEGVVAQPFADLLKKNSFLTCQVIFLGSNFEKEDRCHRIELDTRYSPSLSSS
jgi:hypothetical protein